ncbi:GRAS family protein RAD1-like [Magnolia sinica]|uniref:GRAS family protein RAD1-like n=1 Tax=Magnolia sinica TaxID=86752 RepID=UPI00265886B3|nr:GRAS family protein RAD1-like [Magnolia sinica]
MYGPFSNLSRGTLNPALDRDSAAIRRFCPAGVEEQEELQGRWDDTFSEIGTWSPWDTSSPPYLGPSEQDELVDSFINMDSYDGGPPSARTHESSHELGTPPMSNTIYEEVPMIKGDELELVVPSVHGTTYGVDQGLHLVHLLLACAEAVGCRDTQLATSMLNQIWASANPWGDSLQRVSFCFAIGLKSRLSLLHNVGANGQLPNVGVDGPLITKEEKMDGFHLLHQSTPYIAFGFMAANEAISHAAQGKDSIHIIDLGMEHTLQWPSLIRTLASRPGGPPKTLRITAIGVGPNLPELEAGMKVISDEATSLGLPVEFHAIADHPTPSLLNNETLDLKEGDFLFVNSIMHLHKYVKESRGSLKVILQAIRKLNPALLTVIEQDANHNGPFFLGRFLESLHYYSAIFDSLEVSLPRPSPQRMKIEQSHFAEEIRNIVAFEGSDRVERHERADQWRRQLGRAGFQAVGITSMSQARMMLSLYGCDGYTLASEKGCLLLGWKGRPIMLASAWQVHPSAGT